MKTFCCFLAFFLYASASFANCIGVVPARWDNFFKLIVEGAKEAGKDNDIEIIHRAPNLLENQFSQLKIIDNLVQSGCRAFVIAPTGNQINTLVSSLADKGIPSIYVDRETSQPHEAISVITTNNFQAGKRAGEELLTRLKDGKKIAILRLEKGISSTDQREAGFLAAMQGHDVEIVLDAYIGKTTGIATRRTKNMMSSLVQVDAIFTPNESTTLGVLKALEIKSNRPQFVHIGFDYTPEIKEAIQQGRLAGVIIQNPQGMGYKSIQTILSAGIGEKIEKRIYSEVSFVTSQNLSSFSAMLQ